MVGTGKGDGIFESRVAAMEELLRVHERAFLDQALRLEGAMEALEHKTRELSRSETKYRNLVEGISVITYVAAADENFTVKFISPQVGDILHIPPSRFMEDSELWMKQIHPDDRERVLNEMKESVASGGPFKSEYRIMTGDGAVIWLKDRADILVDGNAGPMLVQGMAVDVTEHKQILERMEYLMKRNQLILDAAGEGIYGVDLKGNTTFINPSALKMLGYALGELSGRHQHELTHHTRADGSKYPSDECQIYAAIKDGKVRKVSNEVFWRKDGTSFPVEYTSTPAIDGGRITGAVVVFRDIAERMHAEDIIRSSLREKELLLKEIHHRVKNNLQVISSLLNIQASLIEDPRVRSYFIESRNRILSMSLVHEMLYQTGDISRINFREYVSELTNSILRSHAGKAGPVELITEIKDIYFNIETAIPCGLIITELVTNSLKYAFGGREKGRVLVKVESSDGAYVLTVADNGIGFPEKVDFRKTTSMGMQIVNTLVQQLRGSIELVRKEKGTEFRIAFRGIKYRERM